MNILGYRDFFNHRRIKDTVKTSVNYSGENLDLAELFYFFETSKQRTWLVATNRRIYIILDDIRKESLEVNKSYRLSLVLSEGKLKIKVDPGFKKNSGRIYFKEDTKGWLYSKKLFPDSQLLLQKTEKILARVS